ncbi:hypothetical protein HK27_10735 [Acetobacter orientalis]|uniref:Uncharacterized protein n=1 Tax=Acetobacter orientalis TaxID=146474 RepID=A0A252A1R3_9PROT|nr:hypothetical protein HK12_05415 [Acetobacter orientalis]OUJ17471.1 hypothetical protein HK27_10735 [Acetobacter orientalis]
MKKLFIPPPNTAGKHPAILEQTAHRFIVRPTLFAVLLNACLFSSLPYPDISLHAACFALSTV